MELHTRRLLLVPATADLIACEQSAHDQFAARLQCTVPPSWPPQSVRDALSFFESLLRARPHEVGWHMWYWIARDQPTPTLVGSGGYKGPPQQGSIEVGYGTLECYQRLGYASEAVQALVTHAWSQPEVSEIVAECDASNIASMGVLERCGFVRQGVASEAGLRRFVHVR